MGKFTEERTYREYTTETVVIDGKTEEEIDYRDNETTDSEAVEWGDKTCDKCNSANVEFSLDETRILGIRWKHIDNEWKWHSKELPENERNTRLGNQYVVKSI